MADIQKFFGEPRVVRTCADSVPLLVAPGLSSRKFGVSL